VSEGIDTRLDRMAREIAADYEHGRRT